MSGALRLALAWLASALVYLLIIVLPAPRPLYLPAEGRVALEASPEVITIGWYGAVVLASCAGPLVWWLSGRLRGGRVSPLMERRLVLAAVLALLLQAMILAWFELLSP